MEPRPKKFRKGTKSCLPCRERKIRCSRLTNQDDACVECRVRGTDCIAQGVVRSDEETAASRTKKIPYEVQPGTIRPISYSYQALEQLRARLDAMLLMPQDPNSNGETDNQDLKTVSAPLVTLLDGSIQERAEYSTKLTSKHYELCRSYCNNMPSQDEMEQIFLTSSWWDLYRDNLGMVWAEERDLESFATLAFTNGHPCLLALLLVCFSISTGDKQYLALVENLDDELASTEHGLNCLIGMGLCYLTFLQPKRAWNVYRRANTLLQLQGLHRKKRNEAEDTLFWTLFHADRWVSLVIGLPYSVPEQLCDVSLTGPTDHFWLYRKLALMTTKVIDCLHSSSFARSLTVEEEIQKLQEDLPEKYLELNEAGSDFTRLYRIVHFHQLIYYVHLPFFLQHKHDYSKEACVKHARMVVEAYLRIYDLDPMVCANGTILNFNAFVAAVVLLLGCAQKWDQSDWNMLQRMVEALKFGQQTKIAEQICRKCAIAMEGLLQLNPDLSVDVPYFGKVRLKKNTTPALSGPESTVQDVNGDFVNDGQLLTGFDFFHDETSWLIMGDQFVSGALDTTWNDASW